MRWSWLVVLALLSGCASYGNVQNLPLGTTPESKSYSLKQWAQVSSKRRNDVAMMLALSGGGTRAAALSYGVLKALRDTQISIERRPERLLDELDSITSVSGGSFTAAYYGLYGDGIFTDFEKVFLKRDVEGALFKALFNPFNWFRNTGRTERAIEYYDENVFHGATFADMAQPNRPLVIINASDLGGGVRFSFVQEYFSLLCSDLATFPVARAVAASSAVPVVFNPVVVQNHSGCEGSQQDVLRTMRQRAGNNELRTNLIDGLASYLDKGKRKYVHFVDGGITDNLGLLALFDTYEAVGGVKEYYEATSQQHPRRAAIIMVDSSTEPEQTIDLTHRQPSLFQTIGAVSDIQLHRYNLDTIELMKRSLESWAKVLSTSGEPVPYYFIQLSFRQVDPERRKFFNSIPTSFALTDEQVDQLIAVGGELLRSNPEFQRMMADLAK